MLTRLSQDIDWDEREKIAIKRIKGILVPKGLDKQQLENLGVPYLETETKDVKWLKREDL